MAFNLKNSQISSFQRQGNNSSNGEKLKVITMNSFFLKIYFQLYYKNDVDFYQGQIFTIREKKLHLENEYKILKDLFKRNVN